MQKKISIVICTYNREKFLPGALASILKQNAKPDQFETIIINNNSTDGTERIAHQFINDNPQLTIRYFVETQKGLSAARNRGIKESHSELIAFIDDDAEITPEYVETAIGFFENNPGVDAIGGKIIPVYENGEEPKWLSKPLWGLVTKVDWGNKTRDYPYSKYPAGASMIFRKKVFDEIGGFNTDLFLRSDDKFIFRQMETAGKKFIYYPKLVAYHHIDAYRTTYESVKKISLIVGASERDRLKNKGTLNNIIKVVEYILKLGAAIIIAIYFLFRFEFKKAEYIIKNRWLTLLGYFNTKL